MLTFVFEKTLQAGRNPKPQTDERKQESADNKKIKDKDERDTNETL